MPIGQNVWIVVPSFNEGKVIGSVLTDLAQFGYRTVVVDDCSTDDTWETLKEYPVYSCRHPVNLGQGAALQTGIRYALNQGAEYIITFDADGQHTSGSIPKLLAPLFAGEADVTLGTRFAAGGVALNIPAKKRLTLKLAVLFTRLSTGLKLTDTHNGLRGLTAEAAKKIKITQNRMAHASQILTQISDLSLRFCEVPVEVVYSEYSVGKGQRISNALNVLWESFTELLWQWR